MTAWYSVEIFFRSERSDEFEPTWEQMIVLFQASGEEEARQRGEQFAIGEEHGYRTVTGADLQWRFHCVARVIPLAETLSDGVEVYSRFLRERDAQALLTPFEE